MTDINNYSLTLTESKITVNGVQNVVEYDEKSAVVKLNKGVIELTGENMSLSSLDLTKSEVIFDGHIISIKFLNKHVKSKFIDKLFK